MSQTNFRSLQDRHEALLQKQQDLSKENQQDFAREVKVYIEEAKRGGSYISSNRERDQLRANLRYWANYIYSVDGTFPDTELAPSSIQSKPFPVASFVALAAVVLILVFTGMRLLSSRGGSSAEPTGIPTSTLPSISPTTVSEVPTQTSEPVQTTESPTPVQPGINVVLLSPPNLATITPVIEFKGTYDNLEPGWAIHVLFIKGDKYVPAKENFVVPDQPTSNDWAIRTKLIEVESPEDWANAQTYSVVLAISLDGPSRELLSNSPKPGININSFPSTIIPFPDTTRVLYRKAYAAIHETRLIYSIFYDGGNSFDLYTSKPDGTDDRRIKLTPNISEMYPNLSPDGTKIVYVKRFKDSNGGGQIYAIAIMDSNGENDHEITGRTKNVLESPQWSPDSSYISYAMGEPAEISNDSYWRVHTFNLSNGEDKIVSEGPKRLLNTYRYHCWIPDSNIIVFNTRKNETGTSGFVKVSIDTPENQSLLFDTEQEELQPNIKILGDEYLLSYIVSSPDGTEHDIYAILDSAQQLPLDNSSSSIRLTNRKAGEIVNGVQVGNADFPISDPDLNSIYYMRNVNIYKVDFQVKDGKLELLTSSKNDGGLYGKLVVETGLKDQILGFDIGLMFQ